MDLSDWRGSGSLMAGYSRQFGNVVLGLDASVDALFLNPEKTATFRVLSGAQPTAWVRQEVSADWMATLRPRVGWAQDRWQVYTTGGPAVTRLKVSTSYDDDYDAVGGHGRSTTRKTKLGWSAGMGGEYALDENWALNAQFLYTDFGSVKTKTHVTHAAHVETADVHSKADLKTTSIMFGLTYRFNSF
ncbi:Outer membrane protein Omp31 (fragment) [uncultured Alphaproteobacteria bacterium]|uniref:Outer membrane protein Omp31 n=1 Tax=uncultured Alphaproteobacteria bacterium TaxID=91750 RepID=A0A212K6F4_9PROT